MNNYRTRKSTLIILFFISQFVYFNGILDLLYLSPALISILLLSPIVIVHLLSNFKKIKIMELYCFFLILYFGFLLLWQSSVYTLRAGYFNEIVRLTFPLFSLLIFSKLSSSYFISEDRLYDAIFYASVFVLVMAVIRVFFFSGGGFYGLKYNSILYPDSNFEGFIAMCLFIFNLCKSSNQRFKKVFIITFISIILSFSRAVWFCSFLSLSLYLLMVSKYRYFYYCIFVFACISVYGFVSAYIYNDGSFLTKLDIYLAALYWFENYSVYSIIFGIGSGNLILEFGRESHNLIGLTIELGLISTFFIVLFWFLLFYYSRLPIRMILPILLCGFVALYPITYLNSVFIIFFFGRLISK